LLKIKKTYWVDARMGKALLQLVENLFLPCAGDSFSRQAWVSLKRDA